MDPIERAAPLARKLLDATAFAVLKDFPISDFQPLPDGRVAIYFDNDPQTSIEVTIHTVTQGDFHLELT